MAIKMWQSDEDGKPNKAKYFVKECKYCRQMLDYSLTIKIMFTKVRTAHYDNDVHGLLFNIKYQQLFVITRN